MGLTTEGAHLVDYARVFCLSSRGWGGGGVASLAPCHGVTTQGSVARLTEAELARLDGFEGGYRKERVTV